MNGVKENILVVGPSWVGDMVMAQSLFKLLKRQYPDSAISVLAPDWSRPLLARMPEVNDSLAMPLAHGELKLLRRRQLGRSLRSYRFTRAYVLPNSFKSALVPFHAGIPRRIGWRGEWRDPLLTDCRRLDQAALPMMVQRFAALALPASSTPLSAPPRPGLQVDRAARAEAMERFELRVDAPILAVCPGAEFGDAKQWPPEHFAALANAMLNQGWQLWLFGSSKDSLAAEAILADVEPMQLDRCYNLAGRTSLGEAIDLLSLASAVVSNDSGLMHVAAALDRPLVAVYGSTSPDFTPPLGERVKSLFTDIECRPCFQRQCPLGHRRCLTELKPERVLAAIQSLIRVTEH